MRLPELIYGNNKTRQETIAFGGVNYSENHRDGEFEHTLNLSSRRYPTVCPREGRTVVQECTGTPSALYAWEKLAVVEGTDFIYDGVVKGQVSAGPKQMCRVGNEIVVWPDKKYYNFVDDTFTYLAVGFTLPWHNSCVMANQWIAVPEVSHDFIPDDSEPVVHEGNWLGVQTYNRRGTTVQIEGSGMGQYGGRSVYLNQLVPGNRIVDGDNTKYVISNVSEIRDYMPDITRPWQIVTWEMTVLNEYTGERITTTGRIEGWAYTNEAAILNASADVTFQNVLPRNGVSGGYGLTGYAGYGTAANRTLVGSTYLNMVSVGDVLNYNASTDEGDVITAITRERYGDHYYASSYTTQHCVAGVAHTYEDPETTCGTLGINVGDRVRVSRGDVSVDTNVSGFTASNNQTGLYADNATLGINFSSDISAIKNAKGDITIDRITDPDLDYVCAHNNRLWGVKGNKIYCSRFGDPQDFDASNNNENDAWWTEIGTPGNFTGIVSYSGTVLCFKENLVHKVIGDIPSEFTLVTYNIAGVQPGSNGSLAIINEILYYKGTDGVYGYNGYTPQLITPSFGERRYSEAVGGTDGRRYWISMRDDSTETWELYCYDTQSNIWLREDETRITAFSLYNGKCYAADYEGNRIVTMTGGPVEPWEAVTVEQTEGTFDRKIYTKLLVRAELTAGSRIRVEISYDGKPWVELYNTRAPRWKVAIMPIRPKRCDSYRLRISGEGDVTLNGIAREVLTGSER